MLPRIMQHFMTFALQYYLFQLLIFSNGFCSFNPNALYHNYYNMNIFHENILSYTIKIASIEQEQTNKLEKISQFFTYTTKTNDSYLYS